MKQWVEWVLCAAFALGVPIVLLTLWALGY
jgi:hypothetical protein